MEKDKAIYFEELEKVDELDASGCGAAFGIGFFVGVVIYVGVAT